MKSLISVEEMKVLVLISDLNCQNFAGGGGKSGTYYTRIRFENSVFIFGKWHLLHQLRSRFLILFLESGTYTPELQILFLERALIRSELHSRLLYFWKVALITPELLDYSIFG